MRRLLPLVMILMAAPAANAGGLVHKMSSSVQLTVDSARTTATRLGSQYSISGSNVNTTAVQPQELFLQELCLAASMLLVQSLQLRQLQGKHSPLVLLTSKAMPFQLQLLL